MMTNARIRRFRNLCNTQGLSKTAIDVWKKGIVKPCSSRIGYLRHKKEYPNNVIFIAGFAKSGSTWFANMVSELDGFRKFSPKQWNEIKRNESDTVSFWIYPNLSREFKHKLAVIKGHTWGDRENVKELLNQGLSRIIVTVRDPRDALISAYWYIRTHKFHPEYEIANSMDLSDYIAHKLQTSEFDCQHLDWLRSWIRPINESPLNIHVVRYEDLLYHTKEEVSSALSFLGFKIQEPSLDSMVEKHSFKKISGRDRGFEQKSSFLRKGISGEWQDIFTEQQKKMAYSLGRDVFKFFKYVK